MRRIVGVCVVAVAIAVAAPVSGAAPAARVGAQAAKVKPAHERFARCPGKQTDGTGCFDVYLGDLSGSVLRFNMSRDYCSEIKKGPGGSWTYGVSLVIGKKGRFDRTWTYKSYAPGYEDSPEAFELKLRVKGDVTSRRMKFRLTGEPLKFSASFPDCKTIKIDETHVLKPATTYRGGGGGGVRVGT